MNYCQQEPRITTQPVSISITSVAFMTSALGSSSSSALRCNSSWHPWCRITAIFWNYVITLYSARSSPISHVLLWKLIKHSLTCPPLQYSSMLLDPDYVDKDQFDASLSVLFRLLCPIIFLCSIMTSFFYFIIEICIFYYSLIL